MTTELTITDRQIDESSAVFAEDLPGHTEQIDRYAAAGLTRPQGLELEAAAARIISAGRRTILQIGRDLLSARDIAQYGTWGPFLQRCGLEERTAQNYMNVARQFGDQPEMISALPATALYLMAAPTANPAVVGEIVTEVRAGAAPTVAEVKQRLAPPAPPPAPPPIARAEEEIATAAPPAPAPLPVELTPLAPPPLPAAPSGFDLAAHKALVAQRALLAGTLALIDAELAGGMGPTIVVQQSHVDAAARLFLTNPAFKAAAAMLAFSAVVEGEGS